MKRIVWIAMMLMLCALAVGGCCENDEKAEMIFGEQIEGELVVADGVITTEWYECAYSEAMIDVIYVEKAEGEFSGDLLFYAMLGGFKYQIFDLKYNNDQGNWTVEYETDKGEILPVSFVMHQLPDTLNENNQIMFMMAQEAVNDIVTSLKLK